MTRTEELAREGWERQATYDEPRLSELISMYEEIGFEVRLEPFDPGEEPRECTTCMQAAADNFKTIFTRRKEYSEAE